MENNKGREGYNGTRIELKRVYKEGEYVYVGLFFILGDTVMYKVLYRFGKYLQVVRNEGSNEELDWELFHSLVYYYIAEDEFLDDAKDFGVDIEVRGIELDFDKVNELKEGEDYV